MLSKASAVLPVETQAACNGLKLLQFLHIGQVASEEQLWQEFLLDPSRWWDNRFEKKIPSSPQFKHKRTEEVDWIGRWSNPHWARAVPVAMILGGGKSGDDSTFDVHYGAPGQGYNRMPGSYQTQLFVVHQTFGWIITSTITSALERGPRDGDKGGSSGVCGYVETGWLKDAPCRLKQQGIWADSTTYVRLLQECITMRNLTGGKQVHAHMIQIGLEQNIFLLNTLVNMYAKCGSIMDARQVFNNMSERDLFTWTTMIAGYAKHGCSREAFKIYEQMQQEGVMPNKVTFICILHACANLGSLQMGKDVHADIVKFGVASCIELENTLVDMYFKCWSMKDACHVFNSMTKQDVVSWNAMIAGYSQHGCAWDAFQIYEQMQREGVVPNRVTFICVLNACASVGALIKGKEVHAAIIKAGIGSYTNLENSLVNMYAKCGSMIDARHVFDDMAKRDVISWSEIITGYAQHGDGREAFQMYEQMQQEGIRPNKVTFICVLNACANLGALAEGNAVHADIIKAGIGSYLNLENALVNMYAKCGNVTNARKVFDNMAKRDVVSWSAMITGYSQVGCGREAFMIYEEMLWEGVVPDGVTFICVLNACANLGALEKGKEVHADIIKSGIELYIELENALLDMYAKCGSLKDSRLVFDTMAERDFVSWSAMLAGYSQHGCGGDAIEIYEKMQWEGVTPDQVTFIGIVNACAILGALDKGKDVHADIIKAGIVSNIKLETTLVHMYAKCGSMKDAHKVFDNMAQRDVVSWTAMITGCAQHGCGREALQLYEQMQQEGLKPNGITFVSVLSACGHVGLVAEGCHYFDCMTREHGLTPTMEHFGCMVDLLGRVGRLDEANGFIDKLPLEPGAEIWRALLSACRIHGNVELAEHAANCSCNRDSKHPAANVVR